MTYSITDVHKGINILDYLDQLTPTKEKGKYICPVCHGNDLSIRQKDGVYTCWSNDCDRGDIARAIAPEAFKEKSNHIGIKNKKRQKSQKEKDRSTQVNAALVEFKVDELIRDIDLEYKTEAQAGVELSAWCAENTCDRYAANQLLRERLKQVDLDKPQSTQIISNQLLESAIDSLIAKDIDGSTLTLRLSALADEFHKPLPQVEKIYYQRRKEASATQDAQEAASGLCNLQQIIQSSLSLEAGLYGDGGRLASQLRETARAMPTASEFLATTLIPVLASRIGTSQTLVISARAGYTVRPIFRTMIVAPTGRKKTPAQKAIVSSLDKLESIHYETYRLQLEQYEEELTAWKRNSDGDEPKPTPPKRKRFVSTDDTLAARIQIHTENPNGLLLYRDEGSAFITERGRFSSGKGDGGETEADLSEFNGGSLSRDRKTDGSTFLAKTGISRTGATQYTKLQRLMGDHNDGTGEWARYLFCLADAPPSYLDLTGDDIDTGLQQTLIDLIQLLDELPERNYLLSHEAKLTFMEYQHLLTDRAMETDYPAMAAALPKFETYFGRFILLLHVVNAVLAETEPAATIEAHTVELARQWTEYFYGQFQLLMAVNSPQQEITGEILTLYKYIKRKGGLTTADMTRGGKGKKAELIPLLNALIEQGHITECEGKYYAVDQSVDYFQHTTQQPETTAKRETKKSVAPGAPPSEPIAIDTLVEVTYPNGETPPPEVPPSGTRGTVTNIDGDSITILISGASNMSLGQRFKTVLRSHIQPLTLIG